MTSIGVVGAGVMGRGIAQLFAGWTSRAAVRPGGRCCVDSHLCRVGMLSRGGAKGRMMEAACAATRERLQAAGSLAGLAECDLVIEAVAERLDVKQELFRQLEPILASPAAILASNTSSLTISEIAAACTAPQRVAGLHFFGKLLKHKLREPYWTGYDPRVG